MNVPLDLPPSALWVRVDDLWLPPPPESMLRRVGVRRQLMSVSSVHSAFLSSFPFHPWSVPHSCHMCFPVLFSGGFLVCRFYQQRSQSVGRVVVSLKLWLDVLSAWPRTGAPQQFSRARLCLWVFIIRYITSSYMHYRIISVYNPSIKSFVSDILLKDFSVFKIFCISLFLDSIWSKMSNVSLQIGASRT